MQLSDMDIVRGAIANAMAEDMSLADLQQAAEHAKDVTAFDRAVNTLAQTIPQQR